jgi:hypothetical protein
VFFLALSLSPSVSEHLCERVCTRNQWNSLGVCSIFEREPKKFKNERKWNVSHSLSLYDGGSWCEALSPSPPLLFAPYLHQSVLGAKHLSLALYAGEFARFVFFEAPSQTLALALEDRGRAREKFFCARRRVSSERESACPLSSLSRSPTISLSRSPSIFAEESRSRSRSLSLSISAEGFRTTRRVGAYCQRIRRRMLTYSDVC